MSLCFLLLRSQFHHFSSSGSGSGGGAAIGATTPTTPAGSSQQLVAWRNPTQVDKVACQLVLRSILHLHHQLAVRVNAKRECALAFGGGNPLILIHNALLFRSVWASLTTRLENPGCFTQSGAGQRGAYRSGIKGLRFH